MPPRRAPGQADEDKQQAPHANNNGVDFAQFLLTLQGFIQQQAMQGGVNQAQLQARPYEVIEQFRKMDPPRLKGCEEPEDTEEWIRDFERIFEYMGCTEEQKVSCAIFQLAEEARYWWESHARTLTSEQRQAMVWKDFKELILDHYFPESYRTQKETEFLNLKQGNLTVIEYEREFNRLSRYVPYLVDTDLKKARRFERGLRPEICGIVAGLRLPTYKEVIDRAQAISHGLQLELKPQNQHESSGKRKWVDSGKDKSVSPSKKWQSTTGSSAGSEISKPSQNTPSCPKCKKNHKGECRRGKNVCYSCGEPGHMSYNCPRKKKESESKVQESERKVKPRVFAITQGDDESNDGADTMSGILQVSRIPALVLFDSGSSHSFISTRFVSKLDVVCNFCDVLEVSIPSGKFVISNKMVKSVPINLDGNEVEADLHMLEMRDFDVILGMDWMGKNYATIRCREREVEFQRPGESKLIFYGARTKFNLKIVTAMKAWKMMRKKHCHGYLVSMIETQLAENESQVFEVPVVKEYIDVFPNELPGPPPDREVEFTIDLVPGATPISKTPYRMAPKELQELKVQLQELLDKAPLL